jgi:hypothetical protein
VRLWPCGCGKLREAAPSSPGTHEPTLRNRGWELGPKQGQEQPAGAAGAAAATSDGGDGRPTRTRWDRCTKASSRETGNHEGCGASEMQRFAREASGFQGRRAAAGRFPSSGRRGLFRSFARRRSNQQSGMRLVPALAGSPCRPAAPQQDGIGRDLRCCYELPQPSAAAAIPQSAIAAINRPVQSHLA